MSNFKKEDYQTIVIDTLQELKDKSWNLFCKHILVKFGIEDIPHDLLMTIKLQGSYVERYDNYKIVDE